MAEATAKTTVTIRVEMTLPEAGLICEALQNPPYEDEGEEHKTRREHLYAVISATLKHAFNLQ